MLSEGQRRRGRGTQVVVGIVQTYGRPKTQALLEGMEIIPPKRLEYRGTTFEEMDTEADHRARSGCRPGGRTGAHEHPGKPPSEALGGRRRPARPWDLGHHHREHPAPGQPQRRRRRDHRDSPAGDRPRLGARPRRSGRAGGHVATCAATQDDARQRLPRPAEGRAGAAALLHVREPDGPPRAGADACREPGGRRAAPALVQGPRARDPRTGSRLRLVSRLLGGPGPARRSRLAAGAAATCSSCTCEPRTSPRTRNGFARSNS